jgi:hypothetical protein
MGGRFGGAAAGHKRIGPVLKIYRREQRKQG